MIQSSSPLGYVTPEIGLADRRRSRRRIFRWLAIVAGVMCLLLMGAIIALRMFLVHVGLLEHSFDQDEADQVVAQVANGSLKPDSKGALALPAGLASASLNGRAYLTVDSSGQTWILFQTWVGKGANLRGYLYHSAQAPGATPATVNVIGPVITRTGMMRYDVESQNGPNWYLVKWDLD